MGMATARRKTKCQTGGSVFLSKTGNDLLIDRLTMTDRHESDGSCLAVDGIDDPKAADTKFPQAIEFPQQRLATFGISGNCANR